MCIALCAPEQTAAWLYKISPGCSFRRLTGLSCPGCGGTRAVHALLHGDWQAAWSYNMFLWVSVLLLVEEYVRLAWLGLSGRESFSATRYYTGMLKLYALATVLWFLLRNVFGV